MLEIDGSRGEGGGQILRSGLALAMVTATPIRIHDIRAKRSKPGLLRQHLTAVNAIAALGAEVEGAALGSGELVVRPGATRGGVHTFAVGSAGSASLVLQAVLPALLAAGEAAELVLEGGTHNPWAPPFDYLERVFFPVLRRMGARIEARLERRGFYPAGGGRFVVQLEPVSALRPIDIVERGPFLGGRAVAIASGIPGGVAVRELEVVSKELGWSEDDLHVIQDEESPGPGNVLMLQVEHGAQSEMFVGFGERGVRAERVARRAIRALRSFLASGVPIGPHLADQLMLPFAIARGGRFRTSPLTEHARTNLEVIDRFLPGVARAEAIESRGPGETAVDVIFGDRNSPKASTST